MESTQTVNTVQQRINERAEQQFAKDVENAVKAIRENPVLSALDIIIGEKTIGLSDDGTYGIFSVTNYGKGAINKRNLAHTNLQAVKDEIVKRYAAELANDLLTKYDEIKAFLEGREIEAEY